MTPKYDPTTEARTAELEDRKTESSRTVTSQLWQKSGSCPEGTIPVLRMQKKGLFKSNSTGEYGRKKQQPSSIPGSEYSYLLQANHSVCTPS